MKLPENRASAILPHAPAWWIGVYTERVRNYVEKAHDTRRPQRERQMWRNLARRTAAQARDEYRRMQ